MFNVWFFIEPLDMFLSRSFPICLGKKYRLKHFIYYNVPMTLRVGSNCDLSVFNSKSTTYSDTFTEFCKESVNRLHASDTVTEFCKSCLNRRNIYCLVTHLFFLLKFRQEFSIFFCSQTLISWICSAICLASISNSSLDFFVSAVRTRRIKYMRTLHLTRSRDGPYTYRHTYTQKLTQTRARAHTHTHTRACGHARTRALARTDRYVH